MKNMERFAKVMGYGDFDHPPLVGESVWGDTLERWRREGLPEGQFWTDYFGVRTLNIDSHGFNEGLCPPFEQKTLERTDEYELYIDDHGRKAKKLLRSTSMPEWLEFPIRDRATFEAVLERFPYNPEDRMPTDWEARVQRWNAPDFDALLLPPAGNYFSGLSNLSGVATVSLLFYDCPDLIHRLYETICSLCCWFAEKFFSAVPGALCLGTGEDLAFKNGPFFSPAMFEEFYVPYYRRVVEVARRHQVPHFYIDSDGNFDALLPQMLDVGMDIFMPTEVAAGMDPVALRQRYGKRLRMIGGVDKRAVAAGRDAIRAEMEKLFPLMCEGGFIPKIDHSVSADISWDNFRYYMESLLALHERCANR